MKLKVHLLICFCLLSCYFVQAPIISLAQSSNVKDCLESESDCIELDDEVPVELDSTDEGEGLKESNQSLFFVFVKMFFALLVVLGLIYLMLRLLNKRHKLFNNAQALENLGGIPVGSNKSIQVIRVGSKMYLVGVGENVELLEEIVDEDVKNDLLHNNEEQSLSAKEFITSLFPSKENKKENDEVTSQFKHMFSTELRKLKQHRKEMIDYSQKEDRNE